MRVDIWTIREEHIVFENVTLYRFTDKEKFIVIERQKDNIIDYYPTLDIRKVRVKKNSR